jgi:mono/diheme cytochrome c family protein
MKHAQTTATALRYALAALGAALLCVYGAAANAASDPAAPAASQAAPGNGGDQLVRGRYLVQAADCAACHTAEKGAPFAGGVALASPFGTLYGTNITPDKEHGIGKWTADDFYKALHDGIGPDGPLYPAMPYTSYRQLTRADTDAIYAYLMSIKPAAVANHPNDLRFPYNMRFGLHVWNMLFLKDALPDASHGKSDQWLRGRYLVNALGHCAECHTARGSFGQLDNASPLAGGALGRIQAPDITPAGLAARGWTSADLQAFLATGIAKQGSAFGEMYPVVHLSTQYMTPQDVRDMAVYLLGDQAPTPQPLPAPPAGNAQLETGHRLYIATCAGCHGMTGEGKPHVAVALLGNSTARLKDPHNLLVSILDGIEAQDFPNNESMQHMPGFAKILSDDEIAQLANYLRAQNGQPADVTATAVRALRQP